MIRGVTPTLPPRRLHGTAKLAQVPALPGRSRPGQRPGRGEGPGLLREAYGPTQGVPHHQRTDQRTAAFDRAPGHAPSPLELPVHGMRLHIHHEVGSGDGLFGSYQRDKEPITVTPAEIIYQRRIAVLDHAARTGNVAETC